MATLGKSGVSVGYYDTEEAAARAYDRAAIGLLGRHHSAITTNFPLADYDAEPVPQLIGKTREEVPLLMQALAFCHGIYCFERPPSTAPYQKASTSTPQCRPLCSVPCRHDLSNVCWGGKVIGTSLAHMPILGF